MTNSLVVTGARHPIRQSVVLLYDADNMRTLFAAQEVFDRLAERGIALASVVVTAKTQEQAAIMGRFRGY